MDIFGIIDENRKFSEKLARIEIFQNLSIKFDILSDFVLLKSRLIDNFD